MTMQCECIIPSVKAKKGPMTFHRVPIDCWTEEDEYRKNNSVWVVYWNGDVDCGGRNDGPIAVYRTRAEAFKRALQEAQDQLERDDWLDGAVEPDTWDGQEGFQPGDMSGGVYVQHFLIKDPDRE